jgi:hypothetical protein
MILAILLAINLTTGREVSPFASSGNDAIPNDKTIGVLWDYTHGLYCPGPCYSLEARYTQLVSILNGQGYTFTTTTAGVNNIDLSPFRIIVLCLGSAWNSAYTAAEADSLVSFVNRGGSLLVLSDNTSCPNGNLNPVLSRFNMTAGVGGAGDCFTSTTANPIYTPIFSGVSQACGVATGAISASSPSEVIAWTSGTPLMAGRCESNKGGVLLIGDINHWENDFIGNGDNIRFMINVFNWLAWPPCLPTDAAESPGLRPSLCVSPNPFRDIVSLGLPAGAEGALLYNPAGLPVARLFAGENDLRELPDGVYFIKYGDQIRRLVKVK